MLNYLANEWILRGEAPEHWLRPVLSTRGEQLIPADDRKEETTLPYSFLPKSRHLSLVPTLSGYALRVSWSWSKLALKSATKFFACVSYCVCLPRREKKRLYLTFCHPFISGMLTRCWKHRIEKHDVNDEKETSRKQQRGKSLSGWHTWSTDGSYDEVKGNVGRASRDLFLYKYKEILSKRKHFTYSRMPKLTTMFVRVPKGQQDCFSTEEIFCSRPRHQYQSSAQLKRNPSTSSPTTHKSQLWWCESPWENMINMANKHHCSPGCVYVW